MGMIKKQMDFLQKENETTSGHNVFKDLIGS